MNMNRVKVRFVAAKPAFNVSVVIFVAAIGFHWYDVHRGGRPKIIVPVISIIRTIHARHFQCSFLVLRIEVIQPIESLALQCAPLHTTLRVTTRSRRARDSDVFNSPTIYQLGGGSPL